VGVSAWPLDRALVGVALFRMFLFTPAYRHSFAVWMKFTVFYAAFLILYYLVGALTRRRQIVAFVLFFVTKSPIA